MCFIYYRSLSPDISAVGRLGYWRDLECLRQTAKGRNDHVTMFILHLPHAVFSLSVKFSSFASELKARIVFTVLTSVSLSSFLQ